MEGKCLPQFELQRITDTNWKLIYRYYFLVRRNLCYHPLMDSDIRAVDQIMGQILTDYAVRYMDIDLAFTDFSIWPFGKGRKKTTIFKFYANVETGSLCGFNFIAIRKILGLCPSCMTKNSCHRFLGEREFQVLKTIIKHSGYKTQVLKRIPFLAADNVSIFADAYIRKISQLTCRVLLVFRLKDCFLYRCSDPKYFNNNNKK